MEERPSHETISLNTHSTVDLSIFTIFKKKQFRTFCEILLFQSCSTAILL